MTQVRPSRRSRLAVIGSAGALALAGSVVAALPAGAAGGNSCDHRNNNTVAKLTECVTLDGVMEHLEAFQAIADAHGDTRASGTPGYTASADYVEDRLTAAGWTVTRQSFDFTLYRLIGTPTFTVGGAAQEYGTAFSDMEYSGGGTVTGTGVAVTGGALGPGCDAGAFEGVDVAGQVAVIQRGGCAFGVKAANAEAAGAAAVVIYNNTGGDTLIGGTLGSPVGIPALDVSQNTGPTLVGQTLSISIQTENTPQTSENVIAELPGRTSDNVVMAGAHLDSVTEGPGINDNGSGSAGLIEVAENLAKVKPTNTIRFAWWGAEESGLVGSTHYVSQLDEAQVEDLALYLNFDMIGSPNFARFIYDGDQSSFEAPVAVPDGSDQIEYVFEDFYESQGLYYEGTEFSGRSDYQAFIGADIPSGGLFTGAEVLKEEYQVPLYGGEADVAYDPNYHAAGDDITNVDEKALDQNSDAVAYAVLTLAYDTSRVNGVAGQAVPGGTYEGDPNAREYRVERDEQAGGGGLHAGHDHGGVEA
ncbi:M28 family peptidase [Geodermatophilus sp. SYSU D01045]